MFVYCYTLVDDLILDEQVMIPVQSGPHSGCSDAKILTIVLTDLVPVGDWGQVDTSALPVKHASRVRGPDAWVGPNGLVARFGRDGAHAEWFYGLRLAARTDLGCRLVRAWAIVPAAVNERDLVPALIEGDQHRLSGLADKGFSGKRSAESLAAEGISILVPPTKKQRVTMSSGRPHPLPDHVRQRMNPYNAPQNVF